MKRELIRLFVILSYLSPHADVSLRDLARALCLNEDLIERDLELLGGLPLGLTCERGRYRLTFGGYQRLVPLVQRSVALAVADPSVGASRKGGSSRYDDDERRSTESEVGA